MNVEQAYINGFVKQAAAYGLSAAEALELLKTAAPSYDTPYSQPTVKNPFPNIIGDAGVNTAESLAVMGANKMQNNYVQSALGKASTPISAPALLNKSRAWKNVAKAVPFTGALTQAFGAYERYKDEDYIGSTIDGVGALGSTAQVLPHPVAKGVGLGVSLGSSITNAFRDLHRYNNRPVEFRHAPLMPNDSVQISSKPLAINK